MAKIPTNTTIDYDLKQACLSTPIKFNEALELGIQIKLYELGLMDAPDCKLKEKLTSFQELAEKLSEELEAIRGEPEEQGEEQKNVGATAQVEADQLINEFGEIVK